MANRKLSAFFQMDPFEKLNTSSDSTVSIIKEGLKKTIDWFSDKSNLKYYKENVYNK